MMRTHARRRASEHALASRSTPTTHRLITVGVVVVADLLTLSDRSSCTNPDDVFVDLDVTVRRAGVVDEAGDIASHLGVHYPCAIQLEAPDVPLGQLSLLAGNAVLRPELLAGVVDDPLVLRNRRSREHTPSMNTGASSFDPVGGRRRGGTDTFSFLGRCLLLGLDIFSSNGRSCTHLGRRRPTRARGRRRSAAYLACLAHSTTACVFARTTCCHVTPPTCDVRRCHGPAHDLSHATRTTAAPHRRAMLPDLRRHRLRVRSARLLDRSGRFGPIQSELRSRHHRGILLGGHARARPWRSKGSTARCTPRSSAAARPRSWPSSARAVIRVWFASRSWNTTAG